MTDQVRTTYRTIRRLAVIVQLILRLVLLALMIMRQLLDLLR